MATKSRAEYFRQRRKTMTQFNLEISKERMEKLNEVLSAKGITKTEWLNKKIDEEIK